MSASQTIPNRRIVSDGVEFVNNYSSTPGGTLYSTTPGGTRIVYERSVLMNLRNSPISKTPPKWDIPQNLQKGCSRKTKGIKKPLVLTKIPTAAADDNELFPMDI